MPKQNEKPSVIRICLEDDGTFKAYPFFGTAEDGDYADKELDHKETLKLITSGRVPIEVATCDPADKTYHNYEAGLLTLNYV